MENKIGSKSLANKYDQERNKLEKTFPKDIIKFTKKKKKVGNEEFDLKKHKAYENVVMEVQDFESNNLDFNLYDSYSVIEKLSAIRSFYQSVKVKTADKLMKELQRITTDSKENKQIDAERKRKVLYINQSKGRIDKK